MTHLPRALLLATLALTPVPASAQLDLSFLDHFPQWVLSGIDRTWMQPLPAQSWPVAIPPDIRPSKRLPDYMRNVLPPVGFERPYLGNLSLTRVTTAQVQKLGCPKSELNLACTQRAWPEPDGSFRNCRIHMVSDQLIMAAGFSPQIVYRHELAHCNGWPGDHPNSRVAPG